MTNQTNGKSLWLSLWSTVIDPYSKHLLQTEEKDNKITFERIYAPGKYKQANVISEKGLFVFLTVAVTVLYLWECECTLFEALMCATNHLFNDEPEPLFQHGVYSMFLDIRPF